MFLKLWYKTNKNAIASLLFQDLQDCTNLIKICQVEGEVE